MKKYKEKIQKTENDNEINVSRSFDIFIISFDKLLWHFTSFMFGACAGLIFIVLFTFLWFGLRIWGSLWGVHI